MKKPSLLTRINLLTRAIIFLILLVVTLAPYSVLCLMAFIFPLRVRYAMVTGWTRLMVWFLRKICSLEYDIEGLENIPKDRNGIVLSKHQSTWETFLLPSLFPLSAIITKRELTWVPCFGWGLVASEPIAINRSDKSSAMEQILTKGKQALDQGRWIIIFPEGTRIAPGSAGNYRSGGARLAIHAGNYPIIPVAHNAGYFWRKGQFAKKPGTIKVVIGPAIETKGRTPEDIMDEVKDWIETTAKRIGGE